MNPLIAFFLRIIYFFKKGNWPAEALIQDSSPLFGDPQFKKLGGLSPEDYTPTNISIGKGIEIPFLPGDNFGLLNGLRMDEDFLGRKITGTPGLGAISY